MVEPNTMEQDLFVTDFIHRFTVSVADKDGKKDANGNVEKREYKFGIRLMTGYEEDKISERATKIDVRKQDVEILQAESNLRTILACLVEAPFSPINEAKIRSLNAGVKSRLIEEIKRLNSVDPDVEKK